MAKKSSSRGLLLFICLLLLVLVAVGCWYARRPSPAAVAGAGEENSFIFGGLPRAVDDSASYKLLTNRAYIAGYSEARRDPIFCAYHLVGQPLGQTDKRPAKFSVDTRTADLASTDDYKNSGYDRGHMVPNHVIDAYFGAEAQHETFLMSNVVPQRHTLNAGVWEKIEGLECDTDEPKFGEMWVIVGPIFGEHPDAFPAGEQVPASCYRIWIRKENGTPHVQAFICPNEGLTMKERPEPYISTVQEIEERTHLDFFETLGAGEKTRLETEKTGLW